MPQERDIAQAAFASDVLILSGTDKLNLPALIPVTCTRIVSFGLAGGLSYGLHIGDVVVAGSLTDGANWSPIDEDWSSRALAALRSATVPRVADFGSQYDTQPAAWAVRVQRVPWYSSGVMDQADTRPQRTALFTATGAWAIDDESYWGAKLAAARGIPFNIVRSISDDASDTLPLAARGAIMNADGSANIKYLLQAIGEEPLYQTLDLTLIAADFDASLSTLQDAAVVLSGILRT
jgi:nucleoside phosphorylase